eukprot:TRINITY_DN320_c0_g1_i2.p1 TRINITY_DN320_c0_g1~~TRINITY_DN320_c0_g1_i2.p1  ORF type:complete len:251 (+),score=12.38 TRINITY_DN320_c0_g1_i2:258-1010(+)
MFIRLSHRKSTRLRRDAVPTIFSHSKPPRKKRPLSNKELAEERLKHNVNAIQKDHNYWDPYLLPNDWTTLDYESPHQQDSLTTTNPQSVGPSSSSLENPITTADATPVMDGTFPSPSMLYKPPSITSDALVTPDKPPSITSDALVTPDKPPSITSDALVTPDKPPSITSDALVTPDKPSPCTGCRKLAKAFGSLQWENYVLEQKLKKMEKRIENMKEKKIIKTVRWSKQKVLFVNVSNSKVYRTKSMVIS